MVNSRAERLDRTFSALSDPTRRALIAKLRTHDAVTVSELAKPFPMTLPAVMKHLDLLVEAGLVARSKRGRIVWCTLTPAPLDTAMAWLERHRAFWSASLDRLEARVSAKARRPGPRKEATRERSC